MRVLMDLHQCVRTVCLSLIVICSSLVKVRFAESGEQEWQETFNQR